MIAHPREVLHPRVERRADLGRRSGVPAEVGAPGDAQSAEIWITEIAEALTSTGQGVAVARVRSGQNGRSTRTFISEGRWQTIVDALKPGDYVFIQFGHNDESKEKVDRYTPPADYRNNLIKFVSEVRAKKATPVLLTPVRRRRFDKDGRLQDTHGEYPDIVRSVATEYRVVLIDMHRGSGAVLDHAFPAVERRPFGRDGHAAASDLPRQLVACIDI